MKKAFCALAILVLTSPAAYAVGGPFRGFKDHVAGSNVKAFTKDLGGVLGSGTFHSGRALGFSGFSVSFGGALQFEVEKGDAVLGNEGVRNFGLPWAQAEIGLPYRVDGFIRGWSFQGVTLAGGGLRWNLNTPKGNRPLFMLVWIGQALVHDDFSANHVGGSFVVSLPWPKLTPFVSAGYDSTRLFVRNATSDPGLVGSKVKTGEPRFEIGFSAQPFSESQFWSNAHWLLTPFRFLQFDVSYANAHSKSLAQAALGLRF